MESLVVKKFILFTIFILIGTFVATGAFAKGNQYNYEIFGAYNNNENESGSFELDQFQLGIAIYDLPVVYGDYPYLLTNFFERRTHLDFSYANSEYESSYDELSGDFYKVNYAFASVGSPLLFNVGAGRLVAEGMDIVGDYDLDAVFYYFGFGYYISPNAVANLELTAIDYELTDEDSPGQEYDYDETHLEATWRHVLKIDNEKYIALLLDVEAIEIGSSKSSKVGASFDYFVNKKVGFGLGYTMLSGEVGVTEGGELTLSASAFMDERIGVTAELSRLYADQSDSDEDSFLIAGIVRFE